MAGHSKWANIRHRKERVDAKRGKTFSRLIKEVMVAAKMGGVDYLSNPRLRMALEKSRAANVPNDNIDRAIKRGGGQLKGTSYLEVRYEGYAVGGVAVLIDCLTDNKNRTLPEVRHVFSKHGGNLGPDGSVAHLFERCGQFLFSRPDEAVKIMDIAIEHDAMDVNEEADGVEVLSTPEAFPALLDAFRQADLSADEADIVMRARDRVELVGEEARRIRKLLDGLEDLEDTQQVYTNADVQEDVSLS